MTTTLTDLQLVLLSSAAARPDGSLLPPPETLAGQRARIRKAIPPLLKNMLVQEIDVADPAQAWRKDGERHIGVIITDAGRTAIGAEHPAAPDPVDAAPDASPALEPDSPVPDAGPAQGSPPRTTKSAQVLALLRREEGATLAELVEATGWLPHTTRAALTGLRKKGHAVVTGKRGETTCYTRAA